MRLWVVVKTLWVSERSLHSMRSVISCMNMMNNSFYSCLMAYQKSKLTLFVQLSWRQLGLL